MEERIVARQVGQVPKVVWIAGIVLLVIVLAWVLPDNDTDETPSPSAPAASSTSQESAPRVAGRYTISSGGHFGCVNRETLEEIMMLLAQGDREAFTDALVACTIYGAATIFEEGEVVYLADTKIWSGMVQVRREDELTKYWTVMEAID